MGLVEDLTLLHMRLVLKVYSGDKLSSSRRTPFTFEGSVEII